MNEIMNLGYLTHSLTPIQQQIPKNCVVCAQPCHFIQIPLNLFVYGNQQVACSENCKNIFQLAQSLTAQQQLNAYARYLNQPSTMSSGGLLPTPTYLVPSPIYGASKHHSSSANSTDIPKPHVEFKSHNKQQRKNKTEKKKQTLSKSSSPKFHKTEIERPSSKQDTPRSPKLELPVSREPIVAIVDTNCLIQRLSDIVNLQYHDHITVVIPQIVIHELDHLKTVEDKRLSSQAQQAIKVLKEILQSNQGIVKKKFRTQETHQAIADELVGVRNNDDMVIQCARYYNSNVAPNKTILVTGDAGLSLKAVMHGIQSKKVVDFLSSLPPVYHKQPFGKLSSSIVQPVTPQQRQENLPYLPAELWTKVFSFLHPRTLPRVSQVCYSFYSTLNKNDSVWRSALQRTFNDYNNVLIPQNTSAKDWYIKWRQQTLTYHHTPRAMSVNSCTNKQL